MSTQISEMLNKMRETGRSMAKSSFVSQEELDRLASYSRNELDSLSYGVIKVDSSGVILIYNRVQSEFAGFTPREVEGKNFFTQLAVCTNNDMFFGTFREGMEKGELNSMFLYTFTYRFAPVNVKVHMFHDTKTNTNWVLVKKR